VEINRHNRFSLRLQNIIFIVLFLSVMGLLLWISQQYDFQSDWTATKRNSISEASRTLLARIEGPVSITAFASNTAQAPVQQTIKDLIGRYQQYKDDIELNFINPQTEPEKIRQLAITVDGELIIGYQGRSEHVTVLNEESITNTLQRLLRHSEKKIVFIQGHGERKPDGKANHDYGNFSDSLFDKGIITTSLTLSESPSIPDNTDVLVIASPLIDLLDGELKIILDYIDHGGNLLWLSDPDNRSDLHQLKKKFNLDFYPGIIVDTTTQLLGINDPSFALVARYTNHLITRDFDLLTMFPRARAINHTTNQEDSDWKHDAFLQTVEKSWTERGELEGEIRFDKNTEQLGPLTIGLAITREIKQQDKNHTQRIVVMGDGDFISNAYLGNGGNQALGFNIINWLSNDDNFISIPVTTAADIDLQLEEVQWAILGLFFLIGLPGILLISGIVIWLKRRNR
jgi:ABC-type uncharacterized transport system involved in gliding motility auxiliary subunit